MKYIKNKPVELTNINSISSEAHKCSIPNWARDEYLNRNNRKSIEDIIV